MCHGFSAYNAMHPQVLETHECWNCHEPTVVARISPCRKPEKLTGMWLYRFDGYFNYKTLGVLCKDCAFELSDKGKVMLGFGGGVFGNLDNWEAILEVEGRRHKPQ